MKVLLIEPNSLLAKTYQDALEVAGHEVVWKQKAQSAIHTADKKNPDIVILELQLPRHNGLAFLYEFRSYIDWQSIPVIVHSLVPPDNLNASPEVFMSLGIGTYLYKPTTSLKKLCDTLDMFRQSSLLEENAEEPMISLT
jgi:DNA-binding response OmpR family regulator